MKVQSDERNNIAGRVHIREQEAGLLDAIAWRIGEIAKARGLTIHRDQQNKLAGEIEAKVTPLIADEIDAAIKAL